jgi:predicted molibdopterin-dependent oxidoreductase YjgC
MGINQSTHGSDGVVGLNNLSLLTGNIGKKGGTSLSITGQCNAMGTREWSSCSGLPDGACFYCGEDICLCHASFFREKFRVDIPEFTNFLAVGFIFQQTIAWQARAR